MRLTSIEYGPLSGGLLSGRFAATVSLHPEGTRVTASTALGIIHSHLDGHASPKLVDLIIHDDTPEDDTGDFMEVLFQFQYYRILHMTDPTWIPSWLPAQTNNRALHTRVEITLEPWLRWQATEVVYDWQDPSNLVEPDLPNNPEASALYLQPNGANPDAVHRFIREAEHPWGTIYSPTDDLTQTLWRPHVAEGVEDLLDLVQLYE